MWTTKWTLSGADKSSGAFPLVSTSLEANREQMAALLDISSPTCHYALAHAFVAQVTRGRITCFLMPGRFTTRIESEAEPCLTTLRLCSGVAGGENSGRLFECVREMAHT